jgi:hypothetical protein
MARRKFPTLWVLILIFGIVWFMREMGYFNINIPWLPVIVIIIAVGAIMNRLNN